MLAYRAAQDAPEARKRSRWSMREQRLSPTSSLGASLFEAHGSVPTRGRLDTACFALGAVFVYQLALLYRHEQGSGANRGLKAFLRAA